jgi:hypothetical protein
MRVPPVTGTEPFGAEPFHAAAGVVGRGDGAAPVGSLDAPPLDPPTFVSTLGSDGREALSPPSEPVPAAHPGEAAASVASANSESGIERDSVLILFDISKDDAVAHAA